MYPPRACGSKVVWNLYLLISEHYNCQSVSCENGDLAPHFPGEWGPWSYITREWGHWLLIFPGEWGPWSYITKRMGTLDPHFLRRMGTLVLYYQENGDTGSPFSRKYGDPLVKMGTPCMADCFPRSIYEV